MSIRNQRFPIIEGFYVDRRAAKSSIHASALSVLKTDNSPSARHRRYFKTWLGRAYDRPAVPIAQVVIATAVASVVKKMKTREIDVHVRDILMVFKGTDTNYIELYAVVLEDCAGSLDTIGKWLNDVATKVSEQGFSVGPREARLESEISLLVIENSYSADLSDITTRSEERDDPAE